MGYDNTDRTLGYGQIGDSPNFKVYYPTTGELISMDATELSPWSNNNVAIVEGLSVTIESVVPSEIALENAYPNPFNPSTNIEFSIPEFMEVQVNVLDIQGRLVATIVDGAYEKGNHHVMFNGNNLSSGLYFIQLLTDNSASYTKVLLLK